MDLQRLEALTDPDGVMKPLVHDFMDGAYEETPAMPQAVRARMIRYRTMNRHLIMAYINHELVGWTVIDNEGVLQLFVNPEFRNQGIASKMVETFLKQWPDDEVLVYTEQAAGIVKRASLNCGLERFVTVL